ncbi:molybdopterin molybdotransferase MoeA [Zobellia uliginosa]|uniref:molybdopterin molybdotransferase MoeA n=1 Tax=Zobellia uliginosa TaxID=143224 RepID=UPI001C07B74F|nr:molybdopterin molybdotransferase MoeA [Zobellia uliginosa]MBU2945599.1 molybdopterin molybdotransferase MoeA [Zobellia uliginosa]
MIVFEDAFEQVLQHTLDLGDETVVLSKSTGRILSEDIKADRDFPPFNRSTKDGIVIAFSAIEKRITRFKIEGILSAGMPQQSLSTDTNCFEIMTGAVLPEQADTIVMYEQTEIKDGWATITSTPNKGQNIHRQGSDEQKGAILLKKGTSITAAVIGVLASVGKKEVSVKKLPKICVVSTGNELVEIHQIPLPHQIRKSNSLSLAAALEKIKITPKPLHIADDKDVIEKELEKAFLEFDVMMLSGGVSKGKFDFIPDALANLGIKKIFHRVAQRPGKPFWFGIQKEQQKVVFSFPGNPVSTFANYHVYFLPWLKKSLGQEVEKQSVILGEAIQPHPSLTLFVQVSTQWQQGKLIAKTIKGNGSGDLVSLALADGFIRVPQGNDKIVQGAVFEYTEAS